MTLNACIFAVAVIWAAYLFVSSLIATGQSGEFMGQKKSGPWFAIRIMAGFSTLAPMFGGYCGAQVIMMWAAMMGVGIANLSLDASMSVIRGGGSMVASPAAPQTLALAKSLLEANLCAESVNAAIAAMPAEAGVSADPAERFSPVVSEGKVVLMNGNGLSCGGAQVTYSPEQGQFNWKSVQSAHAAALTTMQSSLSQFAQQFVSTTLSETKPPDVQIAIQNASKKYESQIKAAIEGSRGQIDALASKFESELKRDGWLMMGAWYQTFANANSQFTKVVHASARSTGGTPVDSMPYLSKYKKVMAVYSVQIARDASLNNQNANPAAVAASASGDQDILDRVFNTKSLGQGLVNTLTNAGTGNGGNGTTNPLISLKNMGDYLLNVGGGAVAAYSGFHMLSKASKSKVGDALDLVTFGASGVIAGALEGLLDAVSPFMILTIISIFAFGATLSIYIPMVPFIIWFGGILTWLTVVVEAVAAAPLWSMAHMDGEGEGMGDKTAHGYIFLLNVMFRPVLMMIGFIAGSVVVIVGGTLLRPMFATAMENAQFDSWTGVISVLGFTGLFIGLSLTLVHSSFNLINVLPDQVFSWIGGNMSNNFGRDMDDKSKNVFVGGVGQGRGAAERGIGGRKSAKDDLSKSGTKNTISSGNFKE